MSAERATVGRMETGTYRQELEAWKRTTYPVDPRTVFRCPWDRCPHIYHQRADLHVHIDVLHHGCAPR